MAARADPDLLMARVPTYAWRAALVGAGFALASGLAPAILGELGVGAGFAPGSQDPGLVMAQLAIAGALVGTVLGLVAMRLALERGQRFLLVYLLPLGVVGLNLVEGLFFAPGFTPTDVAAGLASPLVGYAVLAGLVVLLYGPVVRALPGWQALVRAWRWRRAGSWAWRVAAAGAAYLPIYVAFGAMVSPIVLPYYELTGTGLALPGLQVLVPLELARGLGFTLLAWPLVLALRGSGSRVFGWLALTLVVLAGWAPMVAVTGLPLELRLVHGLELTADSLVHAWVIAKLLDPA